ncbi:putative B3 domain-containing protein At3g24850 [Cynara cardunculus var. scolymus]|uniref:putative B3 domain-containing protein At3g24850 n=1 Tax=Cynara cardunculus var. scolymus TaxID=59895 RepID=UPI000D628AF3|nr:putative B3 domain-containing protein At3g24850 [Cynara cardunculus var. scolymus]
MEDQNEDPLELRLMLQAELPKTTLAVKATSRYVMTEEDKYYLQKINELIQHKIQLFSRQDQASSSHHHQLTKKPVKKRPLSSIDENNKKRMKIQDKKMHVRSPAISNDTTDRLKRFITGEMKASNLKLVIQKILYATDLAKNQNRLSMPMNQLETLDFLTSDEKQLLDKYGEFKVPLLGPTLQMHTNPMTLRMWHLKTTSNYVLKTNWNQFVEKNKEYLTVNTKVQVWSFRREEQLCFAIACV